ncbi:hypothetical protein, conserved [Eimeria necatrix]|uniref:Cilia- and flagella-associated protein 251 n=1 Tax=Eimeria necatrix TaxID=51315 RepID=U6N2A0_9EIME|nr:hypothetical protein, conserved [Eimeria necatrix]CDJ68040.1 hypothetical protein, conserved [Eimeria necatrix]
MITESSDARKGTTSEHQESRKQSQEDPAREEGSPHSAAVLHCTESASETNTPIKLEWAFGFDKGIRNGVHSLSRGPNSEKAIFFPASNTGVIHMYNEEGLKTKAERQVLLRGHINHISVDFTPDAKLIVTLSALIPEAYIIGRAPSQEASNYEDSTIQDALKATETSDAPQENENSLEADIYQGECAVESCGYRHPRYPSTTDGDVVMWNLSLILDGLSRPDERRAVSILRLRDSCVTCLQTVQDRLIVAGFADGTVCFYDVQLRLVRCFEDLDACTFSEDSAHLAVAYADNIVCLFRYDCRMGNPQYPEEWTFAEKYLMQNSFVGKCKNRLRPAALPFQGSIAHTIEGSAAFLSHMPKESLQSCRFNSRLPAGQQQPLLWVECSLSHRGQPNSLFRRHLLTFTVRAIRAFLALAKTAFLSNMMFRIHLSTQSGETDTEVLVYSTEAKATVWSANSMACVKTASVAMGNGGVLRLALMQDWTQSAGTRSRFG